MATKEYLTGGAGDGTGIKVVATTTAGTTIHTVPASSIDTVRLYAYNNHTASVAVTIEWGGVTTPDDIITVTVQPKAGLYLIIPGLRLGATAVVAAFAATANVVSIHGDVIREAA